VTEKAEKEPLASSSPAASTAARCLLCLCHELLASGQSPARLKAFTLAVDGGGDDLEQAREFLRRTGLQMFGEAIEVASFATRPLRGRGSHRGLQAARRGVRAMSLALLQGIRERYPDWRFLADGDGGDENLKDYPIEENRSHLRSVVNNRMLYQECWESTRSSTPDYSGG